MDQGGHPVPYGGEENGSYAQQQRTGTKKTCHLQRIASLASGATSIYILIRHYDVTHDIQGLPQ